jgi:hypothetical protein
MKDHDEEWKSLCRQAAEEQDLEKLLRLAGRIHELLEVKQKRLQGRKIEAAILQIAYDESLLITREQLLRSRGYEVVSVMGNEDAKRLLAIPGQYYRLFIVGHAAPQKSQGRDRSLVEGAFSQNTSLSAEWAVSGQSGGSRSECNSGRAGCVALRSRQGCLIPQLLSSNEVMSSVDCEAEPQPCLRVGRGPGDSRIHRNSAFVAASNTAVAV